MLKQQLLNSSPSLFQPQPTPPPNGVTCETASYVAGEVIGHEGAGVATSTAPPEHTSADRSIVTELESTLQPSLTGDTCRDSGSGVTPGEVHAEYLNLDKQITVKLDTYVDQAGKAKTDFDALMPLVDQMQKMLSQRGSQRVLMDTVGLPKWSEWVDDFRKRLHEDINIRSIQRRLRAYRETPPTKDINVVAKELVRDLDSKKRAEKLKSVFETRNQLNPAIRQELIRALEGAATELSALAKKFKKGFRKLPVTYRAIRTHEIL